ncbi:MAG TPA: hypothetical protein VNK05_01325 [Chloroflexota bacterium]|nr:hypothetical protein [Chloroflexota bacterium]
MGSRGVAGEPAEEAGAESRRAEDALWQVSPPEGVHLLESRPSRTGEGGAGVVARYSDGTTASAMVNSDGSVRVLLFREAEIVPAVPVDGPGRRRFTWERP